MARRRTARALLDDLAARGIAVQLVGSDLELSGPVAELPVALLEEVRASKPALVRTLRNTAAPGPPAPAADSVPEAPEPEATSGAADPDRAATLAETEEALAAAEAFVAVDELAEADLAPSDATVDAGPAAVPAAEPPSTDEQDAPAGNPYRGRILRRLRRRAIAVRA